MADTTYQVSHLLEKMSSSDKDLRFMAANDLMVKLAQDNIQIDDDLERKMISMFIRLLEDKNSEVQNLAVKCLTLTVNKLKACHVQSVIETLCNNMTSGKEILRDISIVALKTIINELAVDNTNCNRITEKLLAAIATQDDNIQLEALNILIDLLFRYGVQMATYHPKIISSLFVKLTSPRQATRKRSIIALSYCVISCSQDQCRRVIEFLLGALEQTVPNDSDMDGRSESQSSLSQICTYLQAIVAVFRKAGHRFSEHVESVLNAMYAYTQFDDEEIRDCCLQGFQVIVYSCHSQASKHIAKITSVTLDYLKYDPNYVYDDGDDERMVTDDMEPEVDDDDDEDDVDDYSDDEDVSWRLRKSAARCLRTIIETHNDYFFFYEKIAPVLILRFKERKENVKSEIVGVYITLLKRTDTEKLAFEQQCISNGKNGKNARVVLQQLFERQVGDVVNQCVKLMHEKSVRVRQDCFALLKELVTLLPGALTNQTAVVVNTVIYILKDDHLSTNVRIDALNFLHAFLTSHGGPLFHSVLPQLIQTNINMINDQFYKITSEALLVMEDVIRILRPLDDSSEFPGYNDYVPTIYENVLKCLTLSNIDHDVKERAISCMGQTLYHFGDRLSDKINDCLPILLDRLKNEFTTLATLKCMHHVATSPLHIDFAIILVRVFPILGGLLRKNSYALKVSTLALLDSLVKNYSAMLSPELLDQVVRETPQLIHESDMIITNATILFLLSSLQIEQYSFLRHAEAILVSILDLLKSYLLHDNVLNTILKFFSALVKCNLPKYSQSEIIAQLMAPVFQQHTVLHKQTLSSMAKCVATVSTVKNYDQAHTTVKQILADMKRETGEMNEMHFIFRLLVIGEIGRIVNLSNYKELKDIIFTSFSLQSEDVKSTASYVLGAIATKNLAHYLPFILNEMEGVHKRCYLLLNSLKEIINFKSTDSTDIQEILPYFDTIWSKLFIYCEYEEEGIRNVVAECLGKLIQLKPIETLSYLKQSLNNPESSSLKRATIIKSLKHTITTTGDLIIDQLAYAPDFLLTTMADNDLRVQQAALITLNVMARNQPVLIRDYLPQLLPLVYEKTAVRPELIREIEMGPFKHKIDDGLDIRKAAHECLNTLLITCLDNLDITEFIHYVVNGLNDHRDIKLLAHLMIKRLIGLRPLIILQQIDRIVEPLKLTCTFEIRANSVQQEFEKHDEVRRSALRVVHALLVNIPDGERNPRLAKFLELINSKQDLQRIYESVKKEDVKYAGYVE